MNTCIQLYTTVFGVCIYSFLTRYYLQAVHGVLVVEMQIIDVDYILVNEKPVIRIFGKTIDGRSVCAFYEGYSPYFYAERDVRDILKDDPQVQKIERVSRKMVMGYQKPKEIYKITITFVIQVIIHIKEV